MPVVAPQVEAEAADEVTLKYDVTAVPCFKLLKVGAEEAAGRAIWGAVEEQPAEPLGGWAASRQCSTGNEQ